MKSIITLLLALFFIQANAQEIKIVGTVITEDELPLPGVNIIVKGTSQGTQTDFDGNFSITTSIGETLVFAYVGFEILEKVVAKLSTEMIITMKESSESLDEVIVTGYGVKTEKKSLGYAVSAVTSESRSSKSKKESDKKFYNEPVSGQLTAAEINDIKKWDDWKKSIRNKEAQKTKRNWDFNLDSKIEVIVKDSSGNLLPNVKVKLYNNNAPLMLATTDFSGIAILFKEKSNNILLDNFLVQVYHNNTIIGETVSKNQKFIEFKVGNSSPVKNDIDIMFTIDATGSMGDEMDYLKSELKNIFSRLDKSIKQKRVALTFYRDRGDEYLVEEYDFNSNIDTVKGILSNHNANGGGDYEEAVEEALKASMKQSWNYNAKSKLLFLLLDAPPHFTNENVVIIKKQIEIAREKGIKIIPIVASDANKEVEFLMRFFSVSTNGTYVFLTDDSGIGNDHLEPTADDYIIEKLNDLIVRLIEKYAGIVS